MRSERPRRYEPSLPDAHDREAVRVHLSLPPWGMHTEGDPGPVLGADAMNATLRLCRVLLPPAGRAVYHARN